MQSSDKDERPVVLIVEDEPILRMAAADMVETAGFEPVEAADATQAVEILETRMDIRIVFTDIKMPRGIDGLKLAALIRDRWPPIHIIVTSGNKPGPVDGLPTREVFFSKPYVESEVVLAMRNFVSLSC